MTEYRDAFEALSERGDTIGATALIERIEHEPPTISRREPTSPRRGLLAAAAAFVVVLAAGIALFIAFQPSTDVAEVRLLDGKVQWARVGSGTFDEGLGVTGPGGFITGGPRDGLKFSADGIEWKLISLPLSADRVTIHASNELWVADAPFGEEPRRWVSEDGVIWTEVPVDPDIFLWGGTGTGFFGRSGQRKTFWSVNMREWTPIEGGAFPREDGPWLFETAAGMVYAVDGLDDPWDMLVTDGTEWIRSELDHRPHAGSIEIFDIASVADTWVVLAAAWIEDPELDKPWTLLVWTSADGLTWDFVGTPNIDSIRTASAYPDFDFADLPTITLINGDGSIDEVWVTENGVDWVLALDADRALSYLAVENGDGTYRGIYEEQEGER